MYVSKFTTTPKKIKLSIIPYPLGVVRVKIVDMLWGFTRVKNTFLRH